MPPLVTLFLSMTLIVALIIWVRVHAFLALIAGGLFVALVSPAIPKSDAATALATDFGTVAGRIGLVIAFAAIIGEALLRSGAAMAIVQRITSLVGQARAHVAMWAAGYVLSVPVFFDTVFYLLVPLARALQTQTGRRYAVYVTAICAGGAATHVFVPPTPGPLAAASTLQVDLGLMIIMGLIVAVPGSALEAAAAGPIETRLPPFGLSLLPIVLPVLLISARTASAASIPGTRFAAAASFAGDPNFALLVSTILALWIWMKYRSLSLREVMAGNDGALASAGVIILITAAGGAYGSMLAKAGAGASLAAFATAVGLPVMWLAFLLSSLLKIAQGSSTVAIITTAGVLQGVYAAGGTGLPHPVFAALACGGGSLVISWMNDSGFWVISRMGGFPERETLIIWTIPAAMVGTGGFLTALVLSWILPLG
jgi:GntP family gluconate:H+ symporter